jgi:hypothetical protein
MKTDEPLVQAVLDACLAYHLAGYDNGPRLMTGALLRRLADQYGETVTKRRTGLLTGKVRTIK